MKYILAAIIALTLTAGPLLPADSALAQRAQPAVATAPTAPFSTINCPQLLEQEKKDEQIAVAVAAASGWWAQIQKAVSDLMKNVLLGHSLHYRLRCDPVITGFNYTTNTPTTSIYNASKNLVNFGVLIILLVIAFANILRIQLDTYAVKKAVPLLLFGVIMANLGLPIIRTIVDFAEVISATFIQQSSIDGTKTGFVRELISAVYRGGVDALATTVNNMGQGSNGWTAALGLVGIGFLWTAFGPFTILVIVGSAFLIMLPAIMFFLLGILFVARVYFIVLLAAASPLAFATLGFEPLRGRIWGWWWKHFISYVFMVPVAFFMFWLGILFFRSVGGQMDIGTYVLILFVFSQAIQLPIKMGTSVMGFWNKNVVAPATKGLFSPFNAGRDYVAKAGPRDVGRFFSSKTSGSLIPNIGAIRGRRGLRDVIADSRAGFLTRVPLNPAKAVREGVGQFASVTEARNAENEKRSAATAVGTSVGDFFANVRTEGRRGALSVARGENLATTVEGRAALLAEAQAEARKAGFEDGIEWGERGYETAQETFNKRVQNAIASNDVKAISAMVVAHSVLKNPNLSSELNAAVEKLKDRGVDIDRLKTFSDTIYRREAGVARVTAGSNDEQYTKTLQALRSDLAGLNPQKQEEYLSNMVIQLKKAVGNLENIKEIEKNGSTKAWAKVLLEEGGKHSSLGRELTPLERHRAELNAVAFASIAKAMPGLIQSMQQTARATGANIPLQQLQAQLEPLVQGFDDARFATELKDEEQFAAILAFEKHANEIKQAMQINLQQEFKKIEKDLNIQNASLQNLVGGLMGSKSAPTKKIDRATIQSAGITDPAQAQRIVDRLEWYNNMTTSMDTLREGQKTHGKRIEAMIKQNRAAGGQSANSA